MATIVTATTDNIGNIAQNFVNANSTVGAAKTAVATVITGAKVDSQKQLWLQVQAMLTNENFAASPSFTNRWTYSNLGTY